MGFLGNLAKDSLQRAMSDKCPYRDMCPSHQAETCRKVEQEVLDCGFYEMFVKQEQEDSDSDIYQSSSSSSSSSHSSYEDERERKRREEDEECRRLEREIAEMERGNEKWGSIIGADCPDASCFLAEIAKCRSGIAESKHFSDIEKVNNSIRRAYEARVEILVTHAEEHYPDAPEFLKYKAEEEAKKKKAEEEVAAKEAAKKAKAEAKKKAEKAKKLLDASKKEEDELIEKEVSKIKRYVWLGWVALNVILFIIADEWYHYVFIVLALLISAYIMAWMLGSWVEPSVKSRLIKVGKIKSAKQWTEEEIKIQGDLED